MAALPSLFWNHVTFLFALTHSAGSLVVLTGLALIPQLGSPFPKAFHIARLGNVFFSGTGGFLGIQRFSRRSWVSLGSFNTPGWSSPVPPLPIHLRPFPYRAKVANI